MDRIPPVVREDIVESLEAPCKPVPVRERVEPVPIRITYTDLADVGVCPVDIRKGTAKPEAHDTDVQSAHTICLVPLLSCPATP
jgi:hypothetical protein